MGTPGRILLVEGDTRPPAPSAGQILFYAKTNGVFYSLDSDNVEVPLGGGSGTGTVTSVNASGGVTGLSFLGGPITTSGTLTLTGTLSVSNGGTGATTKAGAANAILPTQSGNAGKFLTTDGTNVSWATVSGGSGGTVTSVSVTGASGRIATTGSPITESGNITVDLVPSGVAAGVYGTSTQVPVVTVDQYGRITNVTNTTITGIGSGTVTSVAATGGTGISVTGSPITTSGTITITNTGVTSFSGGTTGLTPSTATNGAITLAGTLAIAHGGTGATTAPAALRALLPTQTGNSGKVLTTNGVDATWTTISGTGTVTSVNVSGSNGINVTGGPITTSGTIALSLGNITPSSVSATGTVTGSNLSGINTGDQTITLTGDVTGSGTGSFITALSETGVTPGIYGDSTTVPRITVDAKGRITSVSSVTIAGGASNSPEIVIWRYSTGSSGNFTAVDSLYSTTPGVTATITDPVNCFATYSFTGKSNPPKSIIVYGQVYSNNTFAIKATTSLPNAFVAGGGSSAVPDILTSFSESNLVTLQTRMSDTGASAGVGQRAWLMVVFGF